MIINQLKSAIPGEHHQIMRLNGPQTILGETPIHGVNLLNLQMTLGENLKNLNPMRAQIVGANHQKLELEQQIMILGEILIIIPTHGMNLLRMKRNHPAMILGAIPVQVLGASHQRMKQDQQIQHLGEVAMQVPGVMRQKLKTLGEVQKKREKKTPGEKALPTLGVIQEQAVGVILETLREKPHGDKVEEMRMETVSHEAEDALTVAKKDTEQVTVQNQDKKDPEEK